LRAANTLKLTNLPAPVQPVRLGRGNKLATGGRPRRPRPVESNSEAIHETGRNGSASDYSYSTDHALFLVFFSLKALVALCDVLLLLGLGCERS